jgi:hypothetical protein
MVTTTKNNAFGGHMTEAATFAQDKLEELRAIKWENLFDGNNTDQRGGSTGINYTRNWNVTTDGSLKTITINVNWNDRTAHSIMLVSVLSEWHRSYLRGSLKLLGSIKRVKKWND